MDATRQSILLSSGQAEAGRPVTGFAGVLKSRASCSRHNSEAPSGGEPSWFLDGGSGGSL